MLASVSQAFAWRKLRSYSFDKRRFALNHAKVRSAIQR